MRRASDPSLHLARCSGLRPLPRAGELQRSANAFEAGDAAIRRRELFASAALSALLAGPRAALGQPAAPDARWYRAAEAMKRLAESWGDQGYGAVLVLDDRIVGEGPSRVVLHADPSAHAEREAIRDAQRRLQRTRLDGSLLYSTSRPCAVCEAAAAAAGVSRMIVGEALRDAGVPNR